MDLYSWIAVTGLAASAVLAAACWALLRGAATLPPPADENPATQEDFTASVARWGDLRDRGADR